MSKELTEQEQYIFEAIVSARKVQDFLWGSGTLSEIDTDKVKDICIDMYQKRIDKIKEIDFTNKCSMVELRKRILQNAAISIKILEQIK